MISGSGGGLHLATSGFSDRVEFGELGRIRQDPRVVLRVETLEGDPTKLQASLICLLKTERDAQAVTREVVARLAGQAA